MRNLTTAGLSNSLTLQRTYLRRNDGPEHSNPWSGTTTLRKHKFRLTQHTLGNLLCSQFLLGPRAVTPPSFPEFILPAHAPDRNRGPRSPSPLELKFNSKPHARCAIVPVPEWSPDFIPNGCPDLTKPCRDQMACWVPAGPSVPAQRTGYGQDATNVGKKVCQRLLARW